MNAYTLTLTGAADEVREFAKSDQGSAWDADYYDRVCELVRNIRDQPTDELAERFLDLLMWMIVDGGPVVGLGLSKSISEAAAAMQRKRAHVRKKNRNLR